MGDNTRREELATEIRVAVSEAQVEAVRELCKRRIASIVNEVDTVRRFLSDDSCETRNTYYDRAENNLEDLGDLLDEMENQVKRHEAVINPLP